MRLKREYKEPMAAGLLLLISPFGEKVRRMTADTALVRNRAFISLESPLVWACGCAVAVEGYDWGR